MATLDRIVRACDLELRPSLVADDDHDRVLAFRSMDLTPAQRFENFVNFVVFTERLSAARPAITRPVAS